MKLYPLVLLCASSLLSVNALAQWQWLDAQGRKVFSDLPPPPQVPAQRILQQPASARPAAAATSAVPALPVAAGETLGVDPQLQARKDAEADAAARREQTLMQQQEKLQDQQRQDNCARARVTLATLADGRLVAHTNAQGQRAYMDDNARAQERQRAQSIIASDCGPAAPGAAPRSFPPSALPASLARPDEARPGAARPGTARPGTARPGRPDEPSPPTLQ